MTAISGVAPLDAALAVIALGGLFAGFWAMRALNQQDAVRKRLAVISAVEVRGVPQRRRVLEKLARFGRLLGASPLIGDLERDKIESKLAYAGVRSRDALPRFIAVKAAMIVLTPLLLYGVTQQLHIVRSTGVTILALVIAALAGWRGPDFWLKRRAGKRQQQLANGLSDALDLLVICAEAGLGLEQALDRVAHDIRIANPVVADELTQTVDEMRVLPHIRDALDGFAARCGLPAVRSLVATLVQSLQYGTPLTQSLRVLASEMRLQRLMLVEERAARLPVLMTLPLILFILPCLFLVIAGPAAINVMDTMKH